jgi:hypothetical protein
MNYEALILAFSQRRRNRTPSPKGEVPIAIGRGHQHVPQIAFPIHEPPLVGFFLKVHPSRGGFRRGTWYTMVYKKMVYKMSINIENQQIDGLAPLKSVHHVYSSSQPPPAGDRKPPSPLPIAIETSPWGEGICNKKQYICAVKRSIHENIVQLVKEIR